MINCGSEICLRKEKVRKSTKHPKTKFLLTFRGWKITRVRPQLELSTIAHKLHTWALHKNAETIHEKKIKIV